MAKKTTNTNYDILDKILQESDRKERGDFTPFQNPDGTWVTTKEQFDTLYKGVSDIEKYLRS